ncbi:MULTISPECIES: B12-binding domain-containing radical SAM protein [Pseudothermotoga]|jgi:radical SAM superfamily enzyme YgiQ (UPF0313 family)|uniref:B12-binding domain-containing radical SAM protein n=1 Tax=Pseudothermotoga TaxID=1643951 RepID=UPI000407FC42|nr:MULTISPECIES: radical SAM protein [Pseudothermotoga]KUK20248.1 MAG: Radical SAM domain protein [Pseudothermotoga lettingae]MDI3494943.1 hypothetical protein [Pseudothermotoga sp.]MDK2884877.1 hypothetical protein [Pseudothermotoga sp.]HBJ80585.1 B12-binding domain-containing radical SAM protein [Pseudothermotoga sp.]HBT26282.1 B12-binding domain-containing radical SAM protein [Pseudothermotoga sp.]
MIVLLNPPLKHVPAYEHIGLEYIASQLRKEGIETVLIDPKLQKISVKKTLEKIKSFAPQIIGISIPFQDYTLETMNFVKLVKKASPKSHITVGGIFPTFAYYTLLENFSAIDSIILGEGETGFINFARAFLNGKNWQNINGIAYKKNGEILKNPFNKAANLDDLSFPARDFLPDALKKVGYASMESSRGCYGRCIFCSVVPFFQLSGKKLRFRSVENVVEEIKILKKNHGVKYISFNDANFLASKERAFLLAERIIKENLDIRYSIECRADDINEDLLRLLKESGLRKVFLGIESGVQSVLDRFKKDTTVQDNIKAFEILGKFDIQIRVGFIMFDELTTLEELSENFNFIRKVRKLVSKKQMKRIVVTSRLLPLAGTEYEKKLIEEKKYTGDIFTYDYHFESKLIEFMYRSGKILNDTLNLPLSMLKIQNRWEKYWLKK